MNYSIKRPQNFDEAAKTAEDCFYKKNSKMRLLTKIMISKKSRVYFNFWYYYLRWVDDFIDNNVNSIEKKRDFLSKQFSLVSSLAAGKDMSLNSNEEYFLYHYIKHCLSINKPNLIESLYLMLESIKQDIDRLERNGIFTNEELHSFLEREAKSGFSTTNFFLLPNEAHKYEDKFFCMNTLNYIFFIRDLFEDIEFGYINICKEEIENYNLNINDLFNEQNLKLWYISKFSEFQKQIKVEIAIVKQFPIKLRLFWFWMFPYCVHKMNRIKIYDYNPRKDIPKSLIREIKLYLLTILSAIIYMFKIFLPSKFSSLAPRDGNNQS